MARTRTTLLRIAYGENDQSTLSDASICMHGSSRYIHISRQLFPATDRSREMPSVRRGDRTAIGDKVLGSEDECSPGSTHSPPTEKWIVTIHGGLLGVGGITSVGTGSRKGQTAKRE